MDIVLDVCDTYVLDRAYAAALPAAPAAPSAAAQRGRSRDSLLPRDHVGRQALSLFLITWLFGVALYLCTAYLSYRFVYDKTQLRHPKFLKNQVRLEIAHTLQSLPVMSTLTVPWFLAEVCGYSKLYSSVGDYGLLYLLVQFPLFIMFTDALIYLIHRALHHPLLYRRLHKAHHRWIVPTPFASHAFNPFDGYAQSLPYHLFPFLFPLHKYAYIALFTFINIWTVLIHDGKYLAKGSVINSSAHHTMHHLYFNYNYGQFTTLWDRIGGSHREPDPELFDAQVRKADQTLREQAARVEAIQGEVEGADEREYVGTEVKKAQ